MGWNHQSEYYWLGRHTCGEAGDLFETKWFKMAVWSDILCLAVHVQVGLERPEVLHFQPIALQLCHGKVKKAWRTSFIAEKTWGSQKPRKCIKRWPSRVIPPGEILRVSVRDSVKPWSMRRHTKTWWIWYTVIWWITKTMSEGGWSCLHTGIL